MKLIWFCVLFTVWSTLSGFVKCGMTLEGALLGLSAGLGFAILAWVVRWIFWE